MSASELRSALLKYNPFRSEIATVDLPGPDGTLVSVKVKLKQPSVQEMGVIQGVKVSSKGEAALDRPGEMGARAIIACVRDPDTDEPVFTTSDTDSLLQVPSGSWVDSLSGKVFKIMRDAQDSAKKSEQTPAS